MDPYEFTVPISLEYVAAFTWAASGTIVGIRRGYDFVGVFVVALLSSFGGSLLRDGLFLHRTPVVVTNNLYLPLVLATVLLVSLAWRLSLNKELPAAMIDRAENVVDMIDAIGTPAFVVVGMQLSLDAGIPLPGVLLIGVINGTGGGLLRDILVGDPPDVLKPGVYAASLVVLVASVYLAVNLLLPVGATLAAWGVVVLYFVLRMIVLRYNLRTQPVLPPDA